VFSLPGDHRFKHLALQEDFSMNRRSQGSLPLSKAISGFLQYKAAEGLSPNTLNCYKHFLRL